MKQIKVISALGMTKIEGLAYAQGCVELDFMESAGISIAEHTVKFIEESKSAKVVTLLVGKGNNGGDAYVAGRKLLEKGIRVAAFHVYHIDQCGPLCRRQKELFEKAGGSVEFLHEKKEISFPQEGIILDGLVGTGFKGKAEGVLAEAISKANASSLPILAIDIPSGLNGNTGAVESVAIKASATIYLELPKLGFFLKNGWDHVGTLLKGTFGLPSSFIEQAEAEGFLVEEVDTCSFLPKMRRTRNKYEAGYVLVFAGSYAMTGAAILASHAALRAGAGMVRLFYPSEIAHLLSGAPREIIKEPFAEDRFEEEMKRAKALIIGPGLGREKEAQKKIKKILAKTKVPSVIDADALFFLSENPSFDIPVDAVLTPHTGEMKRLLGEETDLFKGSQAFVEKKKTTLLLKGAPNMLFSAGKVPLILPFGHPGMAKAGSGDVLAGVLGALLAQGLSPKTAAILACYLHGKAGDIAAKEKTLFCMTASDLIESLPKAFAFS